MPEVLNSFYSRLLKVQLELKAPKNQYNSFGNYNYRNAEDILNAVKPLLDREKCLLTLTDAIVSDGGRNYVRATATLYDLESNASLAVCAYAREQDSIKGMHQSQITGSTSSYARKYALNGMFLIDDVKDSDFSNKHDDSDKEEVSTDWITKLQACNDILELQKVWKSMNKTEQNAYQAVKNTMKRKLEKGDK